METACRSEHPDDFALLERVLARETANAHCPACAVREETLRLALEPGRDVPGVTDFRFRSQAKRVRERICASPRRVESRPSLLFRFAGAAAAAAVVFAASVSIAPRTPSGASITTTVAGAAALADRDQVDEQLLDDVDELLSSNPLDSWAESESTSGSRRSSGGA